MAVAGVSGGRGPRVCIASPHNVWRQGYKGLAFEACAAIASTADAVVVAPPEAPPTRARTWTSKARAQLMGLTRPEMRPYRIAERFDLFLYMCLGTKELIELEALEGWRERSGKAAVFLFESWSAAADKERRYYRMLDRFDHVFVFNPNSLAAIRRHTSAPCSYLPMGIDCLLATPMPRPGPRPIDVYGMGRVDQAVHGRLVELTLARRLLYLWDTVPLRVPPEGYLQPRQRTYHIIRNSRFFLSFNFSIPSDKTAFEARGEEAIPARVFEGAAGGAVLLGSAPPMAEFDALFYWPDALIETPGSAADLGAFMADLDRQAERIRRAGLMNATQSLRRHDWAYRWEEMLRVLDLPVPPGVAERKARLAALADEAEAGMGPGLVAVG